MTQQLGKSPIGAPPASELPDWDKPLWDSDGHPHALVAKSAVEVVTKTGFSFAIWDRRTGELLYPSHDLGSVPGIFCLRNRPLTEEERAVMKRSAGIAWYLMHQEPESVRYCVASSVQSGLKRLFLQGPFVSLEGARAASGPGERVFRVKSGEKPELVD